MVTSQLHRNGVTVKNKSKTSQMLKHHHCACELFVQLCGNCAIFVSLHLLHYAMILILIMFSTAVLANEEQHIYI